MNVTRIAILAVLALALVGCRKSYNAHMDPVVGALQDGRLESAERSVRYLAAEIDGSYGELRSYRESRGEPRPPALDALLARVEQGSVYHTVGLLDEALFALDRADEIIAVHDDRPYIRLVNEGGAAFTNLTFLPYRGTQADRILVPTLKTLILLELGDYEGARREAVSIRNRQTDAADRYTEKIEAENAAAAEALGRREGRGAADALQDPRLAESTRARMRAAGGDLTEAEGYALRGEGMFLNPYAEYVAGLTWLLTAESSGDLDQARRSFDRVQRMLPDRVSKETVALLQDAADRGAAGTPGVTHVIFAEGFAPRLEEFRLDLPLIFVTDRLSSFNIAIPFLQRQPSSAPYLTVYADGTRYRSEIVADMDEVIGSEFNARLPGIITKSVTIAVFKSAVAAGLQSVGRDGRSNGTADAAVQIATLLWLTASNQADLRTWRTLPKTYQILAIPTPDNRVLELQTPDGRPVRIELSGGRSNVVLVRHVYPGTPLLVREFPVP
ncbi:MAG: hypothetical protein AAGD32_00105 [Planctomycetota bacterium]